MAESFVERRKRELGLTTEQKGGMSFVERRKIELGLSPPTPEYERMLEQERFQRAREQYEQARARTERFFGPIEQQELPDRIPEPSPGLAHAVLMDSPVARRIAQRVEEERRQEEERRAQEAEQRKREPALLRALSRPVELLERFASRLVDPFGIGRASYEWAQRRGIPTFDPTGILRRTMTEPETPAERVADVAGQVAGYITPGAAIERAAATALRPVIQNLPRAAQLATTGAAAGATEMGIQEAVDVGIRGERFDPTSIALGAGIGAGVGALSEPARRVIEKWAARRAARVQPPATTETATTRPAALPAPTTPEALPAPAARLALPERGTMTVDEFRQIRDDLRAIDEEIKRLDDAYKQAIEEEYQFLKTSRDTRGGVQQGGLIRDETGKVVGRYGRVSLNPEWYQQFYREKGRVPSNKDLRELAKRRVDEGFTEGGVTYPSWRQQTGYDEAIAALRQTREEILNSLRERGVTDIRRAEQEFARTVARTIRQETPAPSAPAQAAETTPPPPPEQPPESVQPLRGHWFTELFGDVGVGISPMGSLRRQSDTPLTTAEQIVSRPIKRDAASIQAAARAAYQNHVDFANPLKDIDEQAYLRAMDASRANNLANVIIRDKLVTPEGQVLGEGLENIFRKVPRGRSRDFLDYLVLRHAATRMRLGHQVYDPSLNMTAEKAEELARRHEQLNPGFAELAREFDAFMDRLLYHYGVQEGLISPELYNTLRQRYPFYIPLRRQFSFGEKLRMGKFATSPSGFSGQKAPIKRVSPTGSARRIVDPRRSIMEQIGAWTNAAMRNRVMQRVVEVVRQNPEAFKGIIEIVQNPKGKPNLAKILRDEGPEDFLEELDNDFVQLFRKTRLDKDNIVRAMVNGQPVYLEVKDPEILKALSGMAPDTANFVLKVFEELSVATKRGATGVLAPMFAVRTLTADLAQALIQSKNPAVHLWDFGHAVISALADTVFPRNARFGQSLRQLAQDYRRVGGIYSAVMRGEQRLQRGVMRMNRYPILSPQYVAQLVARTVSLPFRALEAVANISENVNRMAAFRSEMRRLGFERTPENIRQAMEAAREITVNWSRRGLQSRNIEKVVPYHNAAVQGLHRFAKAWKKNPIKTTAMVIAGVMLPKLYEYLQFHDDPDYQALPAREKYQNLIVAKNPDGTFVRIKMPYEYAAVGAFMVDSLEAVRDGNPIAFKGAADALANTFTPPFISGALQGVTQGGGLEQSLSGAIQSTVLGPMYSIASNRNWAGLPIESMALQDRSPMYRYDERTSAVAKELGKLLNFSPKKIDYVIRAYGGDPARLLLPLTSPVGAGRPRETLLRTFIIDPVFTNTLQDDFYKARERLTQAKRDNVEVGAPLPPWYSEELYRKVTSRAKGSLSGKIDALRDKKTQIQLDRTIPTVEKAQKIRDIQRQINEMLIDINTELYEAGVPMR